MGQPSADGWPICRWAMSEGRYKLRSLCAGIVGGGNTNADQGIAEQLAMQRRGMGGASRSRGRAPARLHAWFQRGYFNHLTLTVSGSSDRYYQIPFGMHWSEVTASSFMEVGIDDSKVRRGTGDVERS